MRPICTNGYLRLPIRIYDLRIYYIHNISGRAPATDQLNDCIHRIPTIF